MGRLADELILASTRAVPKGLLKVRGIAFRFSTFKGALNELIEGQ